MRFVIDCLDDEADYKAKHDGKSHYAEEDFCIATLLPLLPAGENDPAKQGETFFDEKIHVTTLARGATLAKVSLKDNFFATDHDFLGVARMIMRSLLVQTLAEA